METQALRAQRILSIDGGGIRGVVPSLWLEHLEQGLAAHHAGPVAEQFDLLVGNSPGALVVAGLAAGKRSAELARLYEEAGCAAVHYGASVGNGERVSEPVERG